MKRRIILSLAFVASLTVVLLTSSDATVEAQNQIRPVADSNVTKLGPGQLLRLTITEGEPGGEVTRVRFRQMGYTPDVCSSGGVCKSSIASQTTTSPITLGQGEAASIDIPASFMGGVYVGVRGVVLSNSRDVRVNAQIINSFTGEVVAVSDYLIELES